MSVLDSYQLIRMVGTILALQRCPHPNPWTCEYVTLHDKRDFVNRIGLRNLWGEHLVSFRWASCNLRVSRRGRQEDYREGDVMTESELV